MSRILEADDLCKSFVIKKRLLDENDVISAINHVSIGLEEGEVPGIVGGSGCRKPVVMRLLLHSIRPDSGTMKLCRKEYDMAHATGQDAQIFWKNMQMVLQSPYSSLSPRMNVLRKITFSLTANQVPRDEACRRAYRCLDAVGMQRSFLNKYPNSLSGGQRQCAAATWALVMELKIILADELVSALDKSVQAQVLNLFRGLQKEFGIPIISISHDLSIVEYMSDHIVVFYLDKIIECNTSEELYHNPRYPRTKELLRSIPQISEDACLGAVNRGPPIELPSPIRLPSGCRHHPHCPYRMENCSEHIPAPALVGQDHIVKCHCCAVQNRPIGPVEGSLI